MMDLIKRLRSGSLKKKGLVLFLIFTMLIQYSGFTAFAEKQETKSAKSIAPISISIEWGDSQFKNGTAFNLKENNPVSNAVRMKVNYHSDKVREEGYKPGELIITVKGIGAVNRSRAIEAMVGADKEGSGKKTRDWTYTWNRANDTYTLVNNHEIKPNSVLSGYFELVWDIKARDSKNGFSQEDIQAQLIFPDGTSTESQTLSFTNQTKADNFAVYITQQTIYSYEGLTGDIDNPEDYVFVRYNLGTNNVEHSRGLKESHYRFNPDTNGIGSGAIVISPKLTCSNNGDGTSTISSIPTKGQYIFVAYPKNSYGNKKVTASIGRYGAYYEGDDSGDTSVKKVADDSVSISINSDFAFTDIPGPIYNLDKDTYYDKYVEEEETQAKGGDIAGNKLVKGTTETFFLEASLNNSHNQQYTWEIVDDFLYIVKNDGGFRQLDKTEYSFSKVTIPSTSSILNLNDVPISADTYNIEVYAGTNGTLVNTSSKPAWSGEVKKNSQSISLPENTTSIAIKLIDIEESFQDLSIPVNVKFHIKDTSGLAWENQDNLTTGQIINTSFVKLYDTEENWVNDNFTKDNYLDDTNLNLSQKDLDTYGHYLDRERDNITLFPGEKNDYEALTALGSLNEIRNKLYIDFTMGASFDFKQEEYPNHFSLYSILPEGFSLNGYKLDEDIWDVMALSGLNMNESSLEDACTPEIIENYKNSGRTYIALHFDFGDKAILQNGNIYADFTLKADKSYLKKSNTVFARSCIIIDKDIETYPLGKIADDGVWGDTRDIFNDINQNGDTEETLAYDFDYDRIIFADSSQLQMSKYVKTTYSDGFVQLPDIPAEEYGGTYQYKLELTNGNSIADNIVIRDILESGENSQWKGVLQNVDLSDCTELGLSGTVYYSKKSNPSHDFASGDWSTTYSSDAKAVAVDFGNSKLKAGQTLSVILNMKASTDTSLKEKVTENGFSASFSMADSETGNVTQHDDLTSNFVQVKLTPQLKNIIITKEDAEDGSKLSDAIFELLNKENGQVIATATTNSKGQAIFREVPRDDSYKIRETQAPTGYQVIDDIDLLVDDSKIQRLTVKDERKTGTVELVKVNGFDKSIPVPGAEYTLLDKDNNVLKKAVTDAEGKICFTGIPWGKFIVKETKSPAGFQLNDKEFTVEFNKDNIDETFYIDAVDEQEDTFARLTKYAANPDGSPTGEVLSTATFELVRKRDRGDVRVGFYVTDKKGRIDVTDLPYGEYYFREYRAPAGYELANNVSFTLSPDNKEASVTVYDERKTGDITISKKDNLGNMVKGAKFALMNEDQTRTIATATTDEYGSIHFDNLKWGTYFIKETDTPEYYQLDSTPKKIVIDAENLNVLVTHINETKKGDVVLIKTDETGSNKLSGAKYNLYTLDGDLLQSCTTDENGEIHIEELEWGSYYFKEIKAPTGYGLSDDTIRFSVNSLNAGRTQYLNAIDPLNAKTVTLTKIIKAKDINFDNGEPTFMFKLTGTDVNNKTHTYYRVLTFTKNYVASNTDSNGYVSGKVTISGLTAGTYIASEEDTSRYAVDTITDVQNGTVISSNTAELDVEHYNDASAVFFNVRYENQFLSDTQSLTNVLKKSAQLTGIKAQYDSVEAEAGSEINKSILNVTAYYDDGTALKLANNTYKLSIEKFPNVNGDYTVIVSYTEGGITRTDTFMVTIFGAKKKIVNLEASLKKNEPVITKSKITPDMFNVAAVYNDGTKKVLDTAEYIISPQKSPSTDGQFEVIIELNPEAFSDEDDSISTTVQMTAAYPDTVLEKGSSFRAHVPSTATKLIFTDITAPADATLTDVSDAKNGSVVAWTVGTTMYVSSQRGGIKVYANPDCSSMLNNKYNLNTIDCTLLDTSNVINMSNMFVATKNANFKGLDTWDVSSVTNMQSMFSSAGSSATSWSIGDLSEWDVSSVTNMQSMFSYAGEKATSWSIGDLSEWDVSSVTNMQSMFSYAGEKATSWSVGNLSKWNVSSVTDMSNMFDKAGYTATSWSIGNLSNWNVSSVTNMKYMFSDAGYSATSWSIGDLSNWNVSSVTNMSYMFSYAGYKATSWSIGNLSNWNTSSVTDMSNMFYAAGQKTSSWSIGNLSKWNVSNVNTMQRMFASAGYYSTSWSVGDLSNWVTSSVTNMYSMFDRAGYSATSWNAGDLSKWNTSKVTNMGSMFNYTAYKAKSWNIGDLSKWNTSNVTNMESMFAYAGYSASYKLNLSAWNVSKVTSHRTFNTSVTSKVTAPTWVS